MVMTGRGEKVDVLFYDSRIDQLLITLGCHEVDMPTFGIVSTVLALSLDPIREGFIIARFDSSMTIRIFE
jgi:hypothetical protein